MKLLPILVLLVSVAQFCGASPALLCVESSGASAARLSVNHINENHQHGYKFKLKAVQSIKVGEDHHVSCNIELQLDLLETTCHYVNPKQWDSCATREEYDREVAAKCLVKMTVRSGEPQVTKYDCDTKLVKTNRELVMMCPDCSIMLPLDHSEGLKSVREAVIKANQDHSHQRYYVLHDVGRIKAGYMHHLGTGYWAEFALVESHCPVKFGIISSCKPLCPARAGHAFCKSFYTTVNGLDSVLCEFYPALPDCTPAYHCHGSLKKFDPALHPICPWPHPEQDNGSMKG